MFFHLDQGLLQSMVSGEVLSLSTAHMHHPPFAADFDGDFCAPFVATGSDEDPDPEQELLSKLSESSNQAQLMALEVARLEEEKEQEEKKMADFAAVASNLRWLTLDEVEAKAPGYATTDRFIGHTVEDSKAPSTLRVDSDDDELPSFETIPSPTNLSYSLRIDQVD